MGVWQALVSQLAEPKGPIGWLTAWLMPTFTDKYTRDVALLLELRPDDDLLEVACGSGAFLRKYASQVHHYVGVDHSEIQIRLARKKNRERVEAGRAEFVQGDAAHLAFDDGKFSAIACNCMGIFAQPLDVLIELQRVLRPGGRAALMFDYYADEREARKAEASYGMPAWIPAEVEQRIAEAGFSVLSVSRTKENVLVKATKI